MTPAIQFISNFLHNDDPAFFDVVCGKRVVISRLSKAMASHLAIGMGAGYDIRPSV